MTPIEWRIDVNGEETLAVYEPADDEAGVFVCAHGAGGSMTDKGMLAVTQSLRGAGLGVVRFNFLYRMRKSGRPDPMPTLTKCVEAVVERTRAEVTQARLIIGGRSMGGRAASMLAAEGFGADGLLLLAYPLHPAGQPEKLRDAHLPSIAMPVLQFSGTRDELCRRDLMERALATVRAPWTMHWLDGADHSFHVLKSSGRTNSDVLAEVALVATSWLSSAFATPAPSPPRRPRRR
jgi:predicted alpha/beta-hydrolase family hydrolase